MLLHNRVNREELKRRMLADPRRYTTISFYKYEPIRNVPLFRDHLYKSIEWKSHNLGIIEMRRNYAQYFKGQPDFKPFRTRLLMANQWEQIEEVFEEMITVYQFETI